MIGVDANGIIDLDQLAVAISMIDDGKTKHNYFGTAANNETGVLQPIEKIAEMACSSNLAFHSDMVQVFGKSILILPIQKSVMRVFQHIKLVVRQVLELCWFARDAGSRACCVVGGKNKEGDRALKI